MVTILVKFRTFRADFWPIWGARAILWSMFLNTGPAISESLLHIEWYWYQVWLARITPSNATPFHTFESDFWFWGSNLRSQSDFVIKVSENWGSHFGTPFARWRGLVWCIPFKVYTPLSWPLPYFWMWFSILESVILADFRGQSDFVIKISRNWESHFGTPFARWRGLVWSMPF